MNRHDRRAWRAARSLPELGVLTARWLLGDLTETPGYAGPPDPETLEITDALVVMNRRGLVTVFSQPGLDPIEGWDGQRWEQRAAVEGYAAPAAANRVVAAARAAGLIAYDQPVSSMPRLPLWRRLLMRDVLPGTTPVTRLCDGGEDDWSTGCPRQFWREDHDLIWSQGVSRDADDALEASQFVTVVDPAWGGRTLLWDVVLEALGARAPQWPDLGDTCAGEAEALAEGRLREYVAFHDLPVGDLHVAGAASHVALGLLDRCVEHLLGKRSAA